MPCAFIHDRGVTRLHHEGCYSVVVQLIAFRARVPVSWRGSDDQGHTAFKWNECLVIGKVNRKLLETSVVRGALDAKHQHHRLSILHLGEYHHPAVKSNRSTARGVSLAAMSR